MAHFRSIFKSIRISQFRKIILGDGLYILLLGLTFALFLVTQRRHPLFVSNQNTYYPQGLRIAGKSYLQNDWYSNTQPLHIAFSILVSVLDLLGGLHFGSNLIYIALSVLFLVSVALIINSIYSSLTRSEKETTKIIPRMGFVFTVLLIFVINLNIQGRVGKFFGSIGLENIAKEWGNLWDLRGVAGQCAYCSYLIPSTFGILILFSLALLNYQYWKSSAFLLGIATLFQISYLIHSTVIVFIVIIWLYKQGELQKATNVGLIFSSLAILQLIYFLFFIYDPSHLQEANSILANIRIPIHALPSVWWNTNEAIKLSVILIAALMLFFGDLIVLKWILLVELIYGVIGIWYVGITGNEQIALLFPWRATTFLYPISLVLILSGLIFYFLKITVFLGRYYWYAVLGLLLIILISNLLNYGRRYFRVGEELKPRTTGISEFAQSTKNITLQDEVILIPNGFTTFRLEAQRPIYVDYKSHPYRSTEFMEWWERNEFVGGFYQMNGIERQAACQQKDFDYYMIEEGLLDEAESVEFVADGYALVSCKNS